MEKEIFISDVRTFETKGGNRAVGAAAAGEVQVPPALTPN
jgi:hypothetical protein